MAKAEVEADASIFRLFIRFSIKVEKEGANSRASNTEVRKNLGHNPVNGGSENTPETGNCVMQEPRQKFLLLNSHKQNATAFIQYQAARHAVHAVWFQGTA